MATLNDALRPKKALPHPEAVGFDRVYGNEMTLIERRIAPLTWMTPHYRPESLVVQPEARVLDRVPLRMSTRMRQLRSEEMTAFGARKHKDARPLKKEYPDRIRAMNEADQLEADKNKTEFRKRRWWHRQADISMRDPIKAVRYNNLFIAPPELASMKDIVTMQLTGCRLGDQAMEWVSTFMQQSYTLRRINLQGNNLTGDGCKKLVEGIRNCRTLQELDVSLNPIGDDGCSAICVALLDSGFGRESRVYSVNMSTCQLTAGSGYPLARLIREHKAIQSLCLWRNRLGELIPHGRSAALQMLDELAVNPHIIRILDLTANGIMDQDVSEHCRMLEANLRKTRLGDIDKMHLVQRITALRQEIGAKKASAVWENEKIEVKRLEKDMAADMARLEAHRRFEERSQTRQKKLNEKFDSDIQRHTNGLEVRNVAHRIRLVLNGNFSIQPPTLARLREYYDISTMQNIDMYVNMPRRHADLLNYRRKVGEPYETRDHSEYDDHNIFKWEEGTYDPADHHRRRVSIAEYRAEQDRRRERLKPVHFDKFKLNLHGTEEDFKTKKAQVGISVASGVNARVKETEDEDVANGTGAYGAAQQAKLKGNLKDVTIGKGTTKVVKELEPIIIVEKAGDHAPVKVKQTKDSDGNVIVNVVSGGEDMTAAELDVLKEEATKHDPSEGPVTITLQTRMQRNMSKVKVVDPSEEAGGGDGALQPETSSQPFAANSRRATAISRDDGEDGPSDNVPNADASAAQNFRKTSAFASHAPSDFHGSASELPKSITGTDGAGGAAAGAPNSHDGEGGRGSAAARGKRAFGSRVTDGEEDPDANLVYGEDEEDYLEYGEEGEEGDEEGGGLVSEMNRLARLVDEEHEEEAERNAREAQARLEARQQEIRNHIAARKSMFDASLFSPMGMSGRAGGVGGGGDNKGGRSPRFAVGSLVPPHGAESDGSSAMTTPRLDGGGNSGPTSARGPAPRAGVAWAGAGGTSAINASNPYPTSPATTSLSMPMGGGLAGSRRGTYIPAEMPASLRSKATPKPTTPPLDANSMGPEGASFRGGVISPISGTTTPLPGLAKSPMPPELPEASAVDTTQPPIMDENPPTPPPAALLPPASSSTPPPPEAPAAAAKDEPPANADAITKLRFHAASSSAPPVDRLVSCIGLVYEAWAEVRRCAEVGSPSDAELRALEEAHKVVAELKGAFADAITKDHSFTAAGAPPLVIDDADHADTMLTFLEDVVKETDISPNNVALFDALVGMLALGDGTDETPFDVPSAINDRGWIGIAACDGSENFLGRLLKLATKKDGMDLMEIFCSCFYNGLSRIQVTQILLDNCDTLPFEEAGGEGLLEELGPITQEFFEDVASDKKASSRENRTGKIQLLKTLLDSSVFKIDLEREANDRHTILSRALYEGDMPLLELLLKTPSYKARITNPNLVKSDALTPLMMAVVGNKPEAVSLFLEAFAAPKNEDGSATSDASGGPYIDVNQAVPADAGQAPVTAMDMAVNLGRDQRIVDILRKHGSIMVGDDVAHATVANGKATVKVAPKAGAVAKAAVGGRGTTGNTTPRSRVAATGAAGKPAPKTAAGKVGVKAPARAGTTAKTPAALKKK